MATTDDLRQAFLEATGENLEGFFAQWMYRAGHPDFQVSAAWDSSIGLVTLTVRQRQRDSLPADSTGLRYEVPEVFQAPVTIRVGTAAGDVRAAVQLDQREQVIHVGGVWSAPTMVVFDEGNTVLKTLEFAQPTAWLAAQLRADPDLWNLAWVIEQLGARTGEPAARSALAAATTGADYFLTRALAATALEAFPGPEAEAALVAALADTAASVRQAALTALGKRGAMGAAPAVRAHWEHEASDEARAAALTALAQLDPAAARGLGVTLLPGRDQQRGGVRRGGTRRHDAGAGHRPGGGTDQRRGLCAGGLRQEREWCGAGSPGGAGALAARGVAAAGAGGVPLRGGPGAGARPADGPAGRRAGRRDPAGPGRGPRAPTVAASRRSP